MQLFPLFMVMLEYYGIILEEKAYKYVETLDRQREYSLSKGGRCIGKTKWHWPILEMAHMTSKSCFLLRTQSAFRSGGSLSLVPEW